MEKDEDEGSEDEEKLLLAKIINEKEMSYFYGKLQQKKEKQQ